MSVAVVAPQMQKRPSVNYKRGSCPRCQQPMLVLSAQPNAVCVDCYAAEAPEIAIGSQPIPVVK